MSRTVTVWWIRLTFVLLGLVVVTVSLPHGRSKSNRETDIELFERLNKALEGLGHMKPQERDLAAVTGHREHESDIFIDHGQALHISKYGPTGVTNTDEKGLDPNAYLGDILLTDAEKEQIAKRRVVDSAYLWPNGVIPWTFDASRSFEHQASREKIWDAIYHWQNLTCLRFPYGNTYSSYLNIGTGSGCSSYVGHHSGPQPINLLEYENGLSCLWRGTIAHEIGHALGFYHEQSRYDRDKFVEILWDNITPGKEGNFGKTSEEPHVFIEYDLQSIMHYGLYGFSKNGKPTIKVKRQELSFLPGNRDGLTFYDAKLANIVYKCDDGCRKTCHNHGYPFKTPDGQCVCKCPSFLTKDCNTVDNSTTDYPACGGVYELSSHNPTVTITSPNFPNNYDLNMTCVYVLKAPPSGEHGVQLTFHDFEVTGSNQECDHFVQINANLIGQRGVKYCGSFANSPDGVNTFLDHNSTEMMVVFNTKNTNVAPKKGFKFTAVFATPPPPPTQPSPLLTCDFENFNLCRFTNDPTAQYKWAPRISRTPSSKTGPDHAYQGNVYLSAEASSLKEGDTARLVLALSNSYGSPCCLTFAYDMYGSGMGSLSVRLEDYSGSMGSPVWWKQGDQGNAWHLAKVPVNGTGVTQVVFEARRGISFMSDIGLDFIQVYPESACP